MRTFDTDNDIKHRKLQAMYNASIFLWWLLFGNAIVKCLEWFEENDQILCIISWALILLRILYLIFYKKRKKRVIRDVVFYESPKDFTAAEIAAIDAWWSTWRVFPAMLYDWVAKKNVKMWKNLNWEIYFEKITDSPVFFSDAKYIYSAHSAYNRDPEDDFWKLCFANRNRVTLRMLSRIPSIERLPQDFFYQVQRQCLDWNTYKKESRSLLYINWEMWLFISISLICFYSWLALYLNFPILLWIACLIRVLSLYLSKKTSSRDYYLSDVWVKIIEEIQWFKKYLLAVDDKKLKVVLKEDPMYFEKILPYAIAMWIWDWRLNKCFNHLQYDDFWWLISDWEGVHFRSSPEDLVKLKDSILNSISFISVLNKTHKQWGSLLDALRTHSSNC